MRARGDVCDDVRHAARGGRDDARSLAACDDGLPAVRRCRSRAATLASRCVVWDTPDRTVMCGLLVARPGGACACLNRSVAVIVRLYTSLNTKNGR